MDRDTLRREVKDLLASGLRLQIALDDIPDEEVGRRAFGSVNALVDFILAERRG